MEGNILSKFGNQSDFKALAAALQVEMQKAATPQTTTTTEDIIQIDYDAAIQKREITESPFLAFLEAKGRVQSSTSAVIGWRNKKAGTSSKFTPENGILADHDATAKDWEKMLQNMKVITYPIEVTMMAQMGNQNVDLIDDDRQDGYLDISTTKDKAMLLGDHTSDANSFDGIKKLAPSQNKDDLDGEPLTMEAVDTMVDKIIAQGGNPDCLVTTARAARQLTTEQQLEGIVLNPQGNEFVPGAWVRSYYTPNGEIPIITDRNLVTFSVDSDGNITQVNPTSEDDCFVVDSSGVINKNLLPVSEFNLAQTDLSTKSLLATFTAFGIKSPWKQGVISGIGNGT
jgi:hypothetical protein